jgi:pyrroline-5-carboxylate reductase
MFNKSFGFIGGGRVDKILLHAMSRKGEMPKNIIVSDTNKEVLQKLKNQFPEIVITNDNTEPAKCDYVFISLHPPVFMSVLNEIKESVRLESVIISLAPKISVEKIQSILTQSKNVVRMIPNAPSYINKGYNPVVYSKEIAGEVKSELEKLFSVFGEFPEVNEYNLEAYAIVAAMGPTYLWFQLQQLKELGASFGLSEDELKKTMPAMVKGAIDTMFESELSIEEVIDLIPVKPLAEDEQAIKNMYKTKLEALFAKLKS